MKPFIEIAMFIMGALFTLFLVPYVEKRKNDYLNKQNIEKLYIELADLQKELEAHIEAYFRYLYTIRSDIDLVQTGEIPIPIEKHIDLSFIVEAYKNISLELTQSQRQLIKSIPETVNSITNHAKNSTQAFIEKKEYEVQAVKNTIKLSCLLMHKINDMRHQKNRYIEKEINTNSAVQPVLKSLGFSKKMIEISRIEESRIHGKESLIS